MRRIVALLLGLMIVFFTTWGVKASNPINRPDNLDEDSEAAWYETRYTAPVADDDWYLDPEIPLNYIPVPGEDELYMVVDDSGNITGYRKRTLQDDGSWLWQDVNPDIPDNYEAVPGLENVYKVTDEDGNVSYFLYVRNDDDTFCFVPVDENGVPLDDGEDATVIDDNHVQVDGNVYAVYNDDGVQMGYRERVENDAYDEDDESNTEPKYIWKVCEAPVLTTSVGNATGLGATVIDDDAGNLTAQGSNVSNSVSGNILAEPTNTDKTVNADGTYTVTNVTTDTSTENGYTVTYQTTVTSKYDLDGNLLSTKKDGPYEVSRVAAADTPTADTSKIASTLSAELARISGQVSFNTNKANEVLTKLNAERKNQGLSTLKMSTSSDAYKLACVRAADMAIYDHAGDSPMYGNLQNMIARWGIKASSPSENVWKADTKTASEIHTRFQSNEGSRKVRMSSGYTEVGIAVVEKDNKTYIAEVYLQ